MSVHAYLYGFASAAADDIDEILAGDAVTTQFRAIPESLTDYGHLNAYHLRASTQIPALAAHLKELVDHARQPNAQPYAVVLYIAASAEPLVADNLYTMALLRRYEQALAKRLGRTATIEHTGHCLKEWAHQFRHHGKLSGLQRSLLREVYPDIIHGGWPAFHTHPPA